MRICIYGVGSVGGHLAYRLHKAGGEVSLVARGSTLATIRERGLTFSAEGGQETITGLPAARYLDDLPKPDIILVCLKTPSLPSIAEDLRKHVDEKMMVVFVQNGLPWWYMRQLRRQYNLSSEPSAEETALSPWLHDRHVAAGVVSSTNRVLGPAHIENISLGRNTFSFGPVNVQTRSVLVPLAELLKSTSSYAEVLKRPQTAVWRKLQLNVVAASFGCVTGLPMNAALGTPELAQAARHLQAEIVLLANAYGVSLTDVPSQLSDLINSNHKSSMLIDLENNKPIEFGAIFATPRVLARAAGVPVPYLDLMSGLVERKAQALGGLVSCPD